MFTKKTQDIKKSTLKIADIKKDSTARLRHLKTILEHVDSEEAKSIFETNYSHVYYILYDTFVQAENNLKQRVHKAHREELDGSLWLLGKILCLLPELLARRWQCHSLSRIIGKLLHHGNGPKLRRDGVRYFLLWYQCLGDNAPPLVHAMFNELVPGLSVPQSNQHGPGAGEVEFDMMNHPNLRGELGASVFHDTGAHPVRASEITPLLPPSGSERSAAPDPKDGLEILLECMVQSSGCIKWRENSPAKHIRCFSFLLQRFREVYLPVFCPGFDATASVYEPRLDLPVMRTVSRKDEVMAPCVVVLVNWVAKYTHDKLMSTPRMDQLEEEVGESASLLSNLRHLGYTQAQLVRDVLYSTRDTVDFVHEVYRQAFLLGFTSRGQIESMRIAISIYKEWISGIPPPFLLEPEEGELPPRNQRLRTDSYLGAIVRENLPIRAGLQNVLQVFVTNAVNVFMVHTAHLNIRFQARGREEFSTPLDEQTDVCKRVLNIYRTMVMKTRMDAVTWEQLLHVLLQITSVILAHSAPNSKKNLGGRLAQPIFQTLIVTWIRAHTNVVVNPSLWDKFLKVLTSLTHREELIVEWDKTMQTLTRVMARQVYNLNLLDLPLDRLAEQKGKRGRRPFQQISVSSVTEASGGVITTARVTRKSESHDEPRPSHAARAIPGTPSLNRSYSEGSLASYRKSRGRRRVKQQVTALPPNVESSLTRILSNTSTQLSISSETLNHSHTTGTAASGTLRRAISLDSMRLKSETDHNFRSSRTPSPTASSGIEGGSMKDSPLQIDMMAGDSSSIDTQEGEISVSADRRSILSGGTAKGWLPDVAAVMWRRMLGMLGDVNRILNPKLHAQVFRYLVQLTESLVKIRLNQGISVDNQSTPLPPTVVPPVAIATPWCYGALALDVQYREGKLHAMELLCTVVRQGVALGRDQLPLFYQALHQALTGEDRAMAFTALRHLGGPRFLSLLLPGHSLLLLDLVHAATVVLTSSETGKSIPRAEVAGLLGSLLCFPRTSLPGPVLQPSEPHVELMECPDLQEHVLNIVLRAARREPSAKARCIALSSLGQWILQNAIGTAAMNARTMEAMQVILQALQSRHRTVTRVAIESLRLCAERGKELAKVDGIVRKTIRALCCALEVQNARNPSDGDKAVVTGLLLCLGEFCMGVPVKQLLQPREKDSNEPLLLSVFKVTYAIAGGRYNDHIVLFTADDDFDASISVNDLDESTADSSSFQTAESIQACQSAIQLCAKTVTTHLVTNLGHFPIGIGAARMSSLVDEQDDLTLATVAAAAAAKQKERDSLDLGVGTVLESSSLQFFMLNSELIASFVELPALRLPGGGVTAGLVTASRQVRILMRDLNGKACWDASILYREPTKSVVEKEEERPPGYFSKPPGGRNFILGASMDPMMSMVGFSVTPPRHTLRHRPPGVLPVAAERANDLDQLDDLLQYIGFTSPECLDGSGAPLNAPAPSPLSGALEAQVISTILNQRTMESDFVARQSMQTTSVGYFSRYTDTASLRTPSLESKDDSSVALRSTTSVSTGAERDDLQAFHFCRLLFSQLGFAGWERRKRTHLLQRTDKLLRELRNLDGQRCRETHKIGVLYVAHGQEDKASILRNSCGSTAYEMFVSALGWEVELETHHGFLGGLPRNGAGSTAPYFATPFLEIIYHVATRMPGDTPEAMLTKTRHLGNDEVHIVWSEHARDYRRDILPTEFCDVLIVIYPLRSGLFRVTVNRKPEVPWFGPLSDEVVVAGSSLATLVRATAINASRAKRMSLPFYQQFYEERNRSLEAVSSRHREGSTYEDFATRIYSPVASSAAASLNQSSITSTSAAALIDHQKVTKRSSSKTWIHHPEITVSAREVSQHTLQQSASLEHPSPRPLRKFKVAARKHGSSSTPPESPTLPGRRFK